MNPTLFAILAVLREGPAEATSVLDALRRLDRRAVPSIPAFYRHVRKAMDEGWVAVGLGEDPAGPGRPAQTYALTPAGRSAVRAEAVRLQRVTRLVIGPDGTRGDE